MTLWIILTLMAAVSAAVLTIPLVRRHEARADARAATLVVREQLTLGKSDAETVDYLVTRYGNFVLLKPPVEPATWALWLGPFAVLLGGGAALIAWSRRRTTLPADTPLSESELAEVAALSQDETLR